MQSYIVGGIEGGATHSNAVILNGEGQILSRSIGPSTNHWSIGMEECKKRINDMISEAKKLAGIAPETPLDALGLSLSGCEEEKSNREIVAGLEKSFPNLSKQYTIASDTDGSVAAISNKGGIVCIAGTGSNTLLINPDGSRKQCGGWGHLLGDEGSAWKVSQSAIKYCFEHLDDFQPAPYPIDRVWNEIKAHFSVCSQAEILDHFYVNFDKAFMAKLCKKISELAHDGDALSRHLFQEAGRDLAKGISAVVKHTSDELKHPDGSIYILCVGSVWLSWDLLACGFTDYFNTKTNVQKLCLVKLTTWASVGAALMASDKLNIPIARDYAKNYEIFATYNRSERK